jgi:hypothetical protein
MYVVFDWVWGAECVLVVLGVGRGIGGLCRGRTCWASERGAQLEVGPLTVLT